MIKKITIGKHTLSNNIFLAPMTEITDMPARFIATKLGAGLVISEMIASESLIRESSIAKLKASFSLEQKVKAIQIAGASPTNMSIAAKMCEQGGAEIIDINMGCPAKKVVNCFAGSALLKDIALVKDIIKAITSSVNIPVTLKTRLGWDDQNLNAVEVAKIAEDLGIKMITIHGRTRAQMYRGQADWKKISLIKKAVTIPVVANGDIKTPQDALLALQDSECDGIMIGRASQGNPWIFEQINHYLTNGTFKALPNNQEQFKIVIEHLDMAFNFYGEAVASLRMRKHLYSYSKNLPTGKKFRLHLSNCNDYYSIKKNVEELYAC